MSANHSSVRGVDQKMSLIDKFRKFPLFCRKSYMFESRKVFVTETIENVQFHYSIYEMDPLIDSSEMSIDTINRILNVLISDFYRYDCFIIIHGTDTMEHTSTAFSYLIANLSKPIVFTGSQVPLLYVHNDAYNNFYNSLACIGLFISENNN